MGQVAVTGTTGSVLSPSEPVRSRSCASARKGLAFYVSRTNHWRQQAGAGPTDSAPVSCTLLPLHPLACQALAHASVGGTPEVRALVGRANAARLRLRSRQPRLASSRAGGAAGLPRHLLLAAQSARLQRAGTGAGWATAGRATRPGSGTRTPLVARSSSATRRSRGCTGGLSITPSARGFRVPQFSDYTAAWRSALGQALAGGWARYTGNDASHWSASWGNGC